MKVNLIEKWKNRETKRRLREENIFLRAENERLDNEIRMLLNYSSNVCTVKRNVQRVVDRKVVSAEMLARGYAEDAVKYDLRKMLIDQVFPFVEYSCFQDNEMKLVTTATLYVATGDRRR